MKSPLMRISSLFDETRGLAGWEAVVWLLVAACAFARVTRRGRSLEGGIPHLVGPDTAGQPNFSTI